MAVVQLVRVGCSVSQKVCGLNPSCVKVFMGKTLKSSDPTVLPVGLAVPCMAAGTAMVGECEAVESAFRQYEGVESNFFYQGNANWLT